MAGSCPVGLAMAVANTGGVGAIGALLTAPQGITDWAAAFARVEPAARLVRRLWSEAQALLP